MSTQTELDTVDKIAMYLGGGLIVLGIPVMGLVVTLAGSASPMYTYEVAENGETQVGHALSAGAAPDGATVVGSPVIDPNVRAYVVALGLVIFGLYGVYRLFDAMRLEAATESGEVTAD